MGKLLDVLSLPLGLYPGITGHIGDRVRLAGKKTPRLEPPVHDAVEAVGLVQITLDGIGDLLLRIEAKMMVLPRHWSQSAHLPEQPFQDLDAAAQITEDEFPRLLGEIKQDGAGFENRDGYFAVRRRMI